jgi:hypothetical protein
MFNGHHIVFDLDALPAPVERSFVASPPSRVHASRLFDAPLPVATRSP